MTGRQEAQETQEILFNRKPGKNGKTEPRITRMYADKIYSEDCWLQNVHETPKLLFLSSIFYFVPLVAILSIDFHLRALRVSAVQISSCFDLYKKSI